MLVMQDRDPAYIDPLLAPFRIRLPERQHCAIGDMRERLSLTCPLLKLVDRSPIFN